jgi:hypothetical protein
MAGRFDWGSVARRTGSLGCLADSASAKYSTPIAWIRQGQRNSSSLSSFLMCFNSAVLGS